MATISKMRARDTRFTVARDTRFTVTRDTRFTVTRVARAHVPRVARARGLATFAVRARENLIFSFRVIARLTISRGLAEIVVISLTSETVRDRAASYARVQMLLAVAFRESRAEAASMFSGALRRDGRAFQPRPSRGDSLEHRLTVRLGNLVRASVRWSRYGGARTVSRGSCEISKFAFGKRFIIV